MEILISQQGLTWSTSLIVVLVICGGYLLHCRRRLRNDAQRKDEAIRLGIDRPLGQFPYIDPLRCTGCSACILACPEGDVLGIVGGTAVVINGLRCIGIGACEEACPVGAIKVGIGDLKSREDVPLLDDRLQTNLPGVFIAGELGGLSLVSNAVRQGRTAVASIAGQIAQGSSVSSPSVLDLAIVGAGPAGLSAGLAASTAGLSYVILEREKDLGGTVLNYPRRKMVLTQPVDLPPWGKISKQSYEKEDLLTLFQQLADEADLEIRFGEAVTGLARSNGHYLIESAGRTYPARHVLLALGRRGNPRKLGVPGEELPKVMYRLIDARSYRGQKALVVGGGDSAIEAAIALARESANQVLLSYRKEKLVRIKQKNQKAIERLIAKGTVQPIFSSQVERITPKSVRLRVSSQKMTEIDNDYVFVSIGGKLPFDLLHKLGVRFGGEKPQSQTAKPPNPAESPIKDGRELSDRPAPGNR